MNYAIHHLPRIRAWYLVYAIFVVLALAGAADRRAYWPPALVNVSDDYCRDSSHANQTCSGNRARQHRLILNRSDESCTGCFSAKA
jgi:hypothetical protein